MPIDPLSRNAIHLLVVEDDSNDILFVKRAFDSLGVRCPISYALNGEEAIDFLSSNLKRDTGDPAEPALPTHVLLDIKLPRKSGLDVLEWMRQHQEVRGIPVALFTSSQEPSDMKRAAELGVDSYNVKPVDFKEYRTIIHQLARAWKLL